MRLSLCSALLLCSSTVTAFTNVQQHATPRSVVTRNKLQTQTSATRVIPDETARFENDFDSDPKPLDALVQDFLTPTDLSDSVVLSNGTTVTSTFSDVSVVLAAAAEAVEEKEGTEGIWSSGSNETSTTSSVMTKTTTPEIVSASSVVHPQAPSVRQILKFAVPAVGVWLCSPLLSLIDTSAVGLWSGTIAQAALNPAVAVTDYAALLIAFLYTGTTNLIASTSSSEANAEADSSRQKTLIGALQLSTYVGAALGATLLIFTQQLLGFLVGSEGLAPEVMSAASKYIRIRALGMPAAAMIGSAQAACLGMKDIKSPLIVLAAAAVVNFFSDVMLVPMKHPWLGGAAGAAWATTLSQYAAVLFFLRFVTTAKRDVAPKATMNLSKSIFEWTKKKNKMNKSDHVLSGYQPSSKSTGSSLKSVVNRINSKLRSSSRSSTSSSASKSEPAFSVRGYLKDKIKPLDPIKFPTKSTWQDFKPYIVPVTTTQIGRVSGYLAMAHVVASSLGTVSMAAQQVIVSIFYCLTPVADSLSLTAQSFVPEIFGRSASKERAEALQTTSLNFVKAGGVFGGVMCAAVLAIPFLSKFFTADPAVIATVNGVSPLLLLFFCVHGSLCATEGVLLGQKDLSFLGNSYGAFFFAMPAMMLRLKKAARAGATIGLHSVWIVFLQYQAVRFSMWLARAAILQRRTNRQVQKIEEASIAR